MNVVNISIIFLFLLEKILGINEEVNKLEIEVANYEKELHLLNNTTLEQQLKIYKYN